MAMNPRLLVPRASYDPDAARYLAAVEAADGQALETPVKRAVDAFFRDLKATPGLFDAIKASCILCGARTLAGALVPLAGTAPINNNFVAADYARGGATPGLKGDGSTKYLNANISPDDLDTSNLHLSFSGSDLQASSGNEMGIHTDGGDGNQRKLYCVDVFVAYVSGRAARFSTFTAGQFPVITSPETTEEHFIGTRTATNLANIYQSGEETAESTTNVAPLSHARPFYVFAANGSTAGSFTTSRFSFYSIGDGLTGEQASAFSASVSALTSAIGAAVE